MSSTSSWPAYRSPHESDKSCRCLPLDILRKFPEHRWLAEWDRQCPPAESAHVRAHWPYRTNKGRGIADQHVRSVQSKWLRTKEGRARRVEHVHAHIITVRPDTDFGIVEIVCAEMETVAVVTSGGVCRSRNRDALIGRLRSPSELANQPSVGKMIVK